MEKFESYGVDPIPRVSSRSEISEKCNNEAVHYLQDMIRYGFDWEGDEDNEEGSSRALGFWPSQHESAGRLGRGVFVEEDGGAERTDDVEPATREPSRGGNLGGVTGGIE